MKGHIGADGESLPPNIAMIFVDCIENPLIAIEDQSSLQPQFVARIAQEKEITWIFLK